MTQELLDKCDPGNLPVLVGVLETANSVFSRYCNLFEEDELLLEIKHVCKQWRQPFNEIVAVCVCVFVCVRDYVCDVVGV